MILYAEVWEVWNNIPWGRLIFKKMESRISEQGCVLFKSQSYENCDLESGIDSILFQNINIPIPIIVIVFYNSSYLCIEKTQII